VVKKDLDDQEHKLLDLRRDIYVGFKLLGDLINSEFVDSSIATDILASMLLPNGNTFDE
jgi:hypothetical protein